MKRILLALTAFCFLLLSAAPEAHPTASTFAIVRVAGDGTVDVEITADAKVLALTLAGLADGPAPVDVPGATDRDRVRALAPELLRLTDLEVDGKRLELRWLDVVDTEGRAGLVTVRLAGDVPPAAQTLRWRSNFILNAYPFIVTGVDAKLVSDNYDWLAGPEQSRAYRLDAIEEDAGAWATVVRLVPTGFTHILPGGFDHLLFMLGLFLMASTRRALVLQVSAFTLAHSLTLALGVYGAVSIPSQIVEPLIAASIAFIALENVFAKSVSNRRLFVVFVFGLVHGLGFAGVMADLGLSGGHLAASLVGFNAGVELGQLTVIAAASLIVKALRLPVDAERQFVLRPASAAIALTGLFWAVERTFQ